MTHFLILGFILMPISSWAFTLNTNINAGFEQDEVAMNVSAASDCANAGTSTADLLDLLEGAAQKYWNTVSTSRLRLRRGQILPMNALYEAGELCEAQINGGSCPANSVPSVTNDILVACNTNTASSTFSGPAILALTFPNHIENGKIRGAVILINDATNSGFATLTRGEKITILAHELGHALGLGHSDIEYAVMVYKNIPNRQYLSRDDIQGITYLYPHRLSATKKIAHCGQVTPDSQDSGPWNSFWVGLLLPFLVFFTRRPSIY